MWTRFKRLKGWRGALALLAVVIGIPIIGDSLSATAFTTPGAPIDIGGRISVSTIVGWKLAAATERAASWQHGTDKISVEIVDFAGTSTELLAGLEEYLRAGAVTFAEGQAGTLPVVGLGALAMHKGFIATFRQQPADGQPGGPPVPVEGLLAAAASDGVGVFFLAFSPEGGFRLVREDVITTLQAIEWIEP